MKRKSKNRPRRTYQSTKHQRPDWVLITTVLILLIIGLVMVYEASLVEAFNQFGDKFHFAKLQLKWAAIGLTAFITSALLPLKLIKQLALPIFIFSLFLLLIVLIPGIGVEVGGAKRWLDLGFMSLQPSEVAKLAFIIYLAALFEKTAKLPPFLMSLGLIIALIMLQPDLGTTIVISATSVVMFFVAGASLTHLASLIAGGLVLGGTLILSSPYRRSRLLTFMDPDRDPLGASYHIKQIIIALGSGGIFGQGIGRSLQKYQFLPEATTDSIFAVIAEETGFMGTLVILTLFGLIFWRGMRIATSTSDNFLRLLGIGLTCLITLQALLNLSAMAALVPLTGITLPFISYGGSSLLISLTSAGLLVNISRYNQS